MPIFSKFWYGKKNVITCSDAIAIGVKLSRAKVMGVYPITPQTIIIERLAEMINNGEMNAEMIRVEGEHSAISSVLGAQATGVRTFTATCSQGLALMNEVLHIVSGLRLPCVMAVANRTLSSPISVWNDQQDSMSARDTGWIQLYCESGQESIDTIIQAYKIAEDKRVLLPVMVCADGFILTHLTEPVNIPTQEKVDNFLPEYEPAYKLDPKKPITIGAIAPPDFYMDFKKQQAQAMDEALKVIRLVNTQFSRDFKRTYGDGVIEKYNVKGAEKVIVAAGSVCRTIKQVIDRSNEHVGLIRIKCFRPFPNESLRKMLKGVEKVGVIDRAISPGNNGQLYAEVKSAITNKDVNNFILGLGGRDMREKDIDFIIRYCGDDKNYWVNCK